MRYLAYTQPSSQVHPVGILLRDKMTSSSLVTITDLQNRVRNLKIERCVMSCSMIWSVSKIRGTICSCLRSLIVVAAITPAAAVHGSCRTSYLSTSGQTAPVFREVPSAVQRHIRIEICALASFLIGCPWSLAIGTRRRMKLHRWRRSLTLSGR